MATGDALAARCGACIAKIPVEGRVRFPKAPEPNRALMRRIECEPPVASGAATVVIACRLVALSAAFGWLTISRDLVEDSLHRGIAE